jgi:hypothetical protein
MRKLFLLLLIFSPITVISQKIGALHTVSLSSGSLKHFYTDIDTNSSIFPTFISKTDVKDFSFRASMDYACQFNIPITRDFSVAPTIGFGLGYIPGGGDFASSKTDEIEADGINFAIVKSSIKDRFMLNIPIGFQIDYGSRATTKARKWLGGYIMGGFNYGVYGPVGGKSSFIMEAGIRGYVIGIKFFNHFFVPNSGVQRLDQKMSSFGFGLTVIL